MNQCPVKGNKKQCNYTLRLKVYSLLFSRTLFFCMGIPDFLVYMEHPVLLEGRDSRRREESPNLKPLALVFSQSIALVSYSLKFFSVLGGPVTTACKCCGQIFVIQRLIWDLLKHFHYRPQLRLPVCIPGHKICFGRDSYKAGFLSIKQHFYAHFYSPPGPQTLVSRQVACHFYYTFYAVVHSFVGSGLANVFDQDMVITTLVYSELIRFFW